jgi:integrase
MMWLGAVLGLRWSEAAAITPGRLRFLEGRLTVDRQLTRSGGFAPPKSAASHRTMACPVWLLEELAALLARRGLSAADVDALVFVSDNGTPLDYPNWRQRTWMPACERAGLAGLRFHDLRSMAATALVSAGVDVKVAQTRLGHSSPHVTLALYARATTEADRRAAELVSEVFRPRDARAMEAEVEDPRGDRSSLSWENGWALEDSNLRPQPCEAVPG